MSRGCRSRSAHETPKWPRMQPRSTVGSRGSLLGAPLKRLKSRGQTAKLGWERRITQANAELFYHILTNLGHFLPNRGLGAPYARNGFVRLDVFARSDAVGGVEQLSFGAALGNVSTMQEDELIAEEL